MYSLAWKTTEKQLTEVNKMKVVQHAIFEKADSLVTSSANSKENLIYVMQWE
jgi:hypothetical protein